MAQMLLLGDEDVIQAEYRGLKELAAASKNATSRQSGGGCRQRVCLKAARTIGGRGCRVILICICYTRILVQQEQ